MALFGRKTQDNKEDAAPIAAASNAGTSKRDISHVLKHARITEKATMHSSTGVYTFDVAESATKKDISAAIRALYKVTPHKIAIVHVPSKVRRSMRTGKTGVKHGGKKAYVYLKKGESITIS